MSHKVLAPLTLLLSFSAWAATPGGIPLSDLDALAAAKCEEKLNPKKGPPAEAQAQSAQPPVAARSAPPENVPNTADRDMAREAVIWKESWPGSGLSWFRLIDGAERSNLLVKEAFTTQTASYITRAAAHVPGDYYTNLPKALQEQASGLFRGTIEHLFLELFEARGANGISEILNSARVPGEAVEKFMSILRDRVADVNQAKALWRKMVEYEDLIVTAKRIGADKGDHFYSTDSLLEGVLQMRVKNNSGNLQKTWVAQAMEKYLSIDAESLSVAIDSIRGDQSIRVEDKNYDLKPPSVDGMLKDLTAMAARGLLQPAYGRDLEVQKAIQIMSRRMKANPVLLGEAGVGKTQIAKHIALLAYQQKLTPQLNSYRYMELDLAGMASDTKYRGQFERKAKILIDKVKKERIKLFIDEIHMLMGAGAANGSQSSSLDQIFKPALAAEGAEFSVIGGTTKDEYRKYIEKDKAMVRRFEPVEVDSPSSDDATAIVNKVIGAYAKYHHVVVPAQEQLALARTLVEVSTRHKKAMAQPDNAITLLDDVTSDAALHSQAPADPALNAQYQELAALYRQRETLLATEARNESASGEEGVLPKLDETLKKIQEISLRIDRLQAQLGVSPPQVTAADVIAFMKKRTGRDFTLSPAQDRAQRMQKAAAELSSKLVGQAKLLTNFTNYTRKRALGLGTAKGAPDSFIVVGAKGLQQEEVLETFRSTAVASADDILELRADEYAGRYEELRLLLGHFNTEHPEGLIIVDEPTVLDTLGKNLLAVIQSTGKVELPRTLGGVDHKCDFGDTVIVTMSSVGTDPQDAFKFSSTNFQDEMAIRKMLVQEFGSDRLVASYGAVLRLENLSTPELQVAYMEHLAGRTNAELAEVGRTQNQPAYSIALTDGAKRWLRKDYLPDNGGAEALVYKYRDEVEGPLLQAIMDNKGAIPAGARFVVDAVGEDEAAHLEIRVE